MRYRLHKLGETKVSSAYCPVCTVKTVEITGKLKPQWLGHPVMGAYDGLVSPNNLCCGNECLDTYIRGIKQYMLENSDRSILNSSIFKNRVSKLTAYGMIPEGF